MAKFKIEKNKNFVDYDVYGINDYIIFENVQLTESAGQINFISQNPISSLIVLKGTTKIDKIAKFSSSGLDIDIYNTYATNNGYIPYSQDEIKELSNRVANQDTFTNEELEMYDCNGDGQITSSDILILQKIFLCGATKENPAHISINTSTTSDPNGTRDIIALTDGNGNNRASMGLDGFYENGRKLTSQNILWQGASFMNQNQTIELNEKISKQPHGIILIFSAYDNGAQNYYVTEHFVPKSFLEVIGSGVGHTFMMCGNNFGSMASKYLYISDDRISGHISNEQKGTNNGITYNNSSHCLRAVIGI
jgi:hypothetical protein